MSAREGLFAEVVPDNQLEEAAMTVAERLAAGPRPANIIPKLALRRAEHVDFGTELECEAYWTYPGFGRDLG